MNFGWRVMFNGLPAPVYFARTDQLNVQVPYEISGIKEANVRVTYQGAPSSAVAVPVRTTHPGVLPQLFNQDGSPRGQPRQQDSLTSFFGDAIWFFGQVQL